jgi:hypothetical protein
VNVQIENTLRPSARTMPTVRGDLLSCYTTSIATYLAHAGIDPDFALGIQFFIAIRFCSEDPPTCAFLHYHTPLIGAAPTHRAALRRRWTCSLGEARAAIAAECRRTGMAIVSSDAYRLPWTTAYRARHAPHWFIVDGERGPDRLLHVSDRFEYVDEIGVQTPYEGLVAFETLRGQCDARPSPPALRFRSVWAFGQEDCGPPAPVDAIEWFETESPARAEALTPQVLLNFLAVACERYAGDFRRADLSGWMVGAEAIMTFAEWTRRHLCDPRLYVVSDDLWVIARNRAYFAVALDRVGSLASRPDLKRVASAIREELVPAWFAIPRVLRYNAACLDRGRPPRQIVVELLQDVAQREAAINGELRSLLQ